jgi:predicted dehydrogenase
MRHRVALIGLGRIGWSLERDRLRSHPCTHAGALLALPRRFEICAVADQNSDRITEFLEWNSGPAPRAYASAEELFARESVDLAVISARSAAHRDLALAAGRSGARAVLLEKPMALNAAGAQEIADCYSAGAPLFWINFERRYHPGYQRVRQFIAEQKLGALRAVHGWMLTGPTPANESEAGPLLHDGVHWIDLLVWCCGVPQNIAARLFPSAAPGFEDHAFIEFDYPEFRARLEAGGRRRYFEFTAQFDFENGRIRAGNEGFFFFKSAPSRRYAKFRELQPFRAAIPAKNPWLELYGEIARHLDQLRRAAHWVQPEAGEIEAPIRAASRRRTAEALAVHKIIDQCLRAGFKAG